MSLIPQTVTLMVIAAVFLGIGTRGLLRRRPQIFSSRWLFAIVAVCFLNPALGLRDLPDFDFSSFPAFLMVLPVILLGSLVLLLVFVWKTMQGYTFIGVTDESIRQALHHALGSLGLPFEERVSAVRLTSLNADLKVAVQSWVGTATIALIPVGRRQELQAIIARMREFFAANAVATNRVTPFFYTLLGLMMLALAAITLRLDRDIRGRHDHTHLLGTVAPNFVLTTLAGDRFELAESAGKEIVVLNFFATWCGPCKIEMPELVAAAQAEHEIPLTLIGIDADEHRMTVESFVREHGISFPVGIDASTLREQYGVSGYPTTVVIGLDGRIQRHHTGVVQDARQFFSALVEENRKLMEAGGAVSRDDYLRAHERQQRESMPEPLREPRVLTSEVLLEKSPWFSYQSPCQTVSDIAWGDFNARPGNEVLLVDCDSIRTVSLEGNLLDERALGLRMRFPRIVRTGAASSDWLLLDEGRWDRVQAVRSSGETLFTKEEKDVWFGASAGNTDDDPLPEFVIYRYNSGVIELREDDGAFIRRFDTGDAIEHVNIWSPPDAPPRLVYSILDDDLVQLDLEGNELARHEAESPALNFTEEVSWPAVSSEPLYIQTYWDTLHLLEPAGRRARRLVSPLLDQQLLWVPLRATIVPRRDGGGPLLAVAIRLWKHPRSVLHLYDSSGKLLYYELLEGMYGGLTAIDESNRPSAILLAGRDHVLRYELQ